MKSINFEYNCPECKEKLLHVENKLHCNNCLCDYEHKNDCTIFKNQNLSYASDNNQSIKELLAEIKDNNFETAVEKFLISNHELSSQLVNTQYDKSVDIIFHGVGNNYLRCLDIKSELGNKAEILSNIFKQVYAIEFDDDYIELQKKRFEERKLQNISITKCDLLKLPFPDDFFDMILCNGVLENITKFIKSYNQSEAQKQFVEELKRVINDDGCIIFGVNNNGGLRTKWKGSNEESASSPEIISNQKFSNYTSVFENSGLRTKSFWVLPSYDIPYYSGEINDNVALKGFFRNLSIFIAAMRGGRRQGKIREIMLSLFRNLNYPFIKPMVKKFSSSFVFCCWKKDNLNSLENWIKEETGYRNLIRMSRHEKILYVLLNTKGEIEKGVYFKRYGYEMPNKIKFFERKFPNVKPPSERIWIVDWLKGRASNPENEKEVIAVIDWLVEFQKKTKLRIMSKDDAIQETMFIKKGLDHFGYENANKYYKLLEQYEKYIEKNQINMTPVHGDFWFPNLLYDHETNNINVIDWEGYSEKGNPYEDFMWFLCNFMGLSSANPILKFRECLAGHGEISRTIEHIKNRIDSHFGFKLDYSLLLSINLMKRMIIEDQIEEKNSSKENKPKKAHSRVQSKMLDVLSEYQ